MRNSSTTSSAYMVSNCFVHFQMEIVSQSVKLFDMIPFSLFLICFANNVYKSFHLKLANSTSNMREGFIKISAHPNYSHLSYVRLAPSQIIKFNYFSVFHALNCLEQALCHGDHMKSVATSFSVPLFCPNSYVNPVIIHVCMQFMTLINLVFQTIVIV